MNWRCWTAGRAEGIYYVELGLLYTGRFIEEVSEHEESFFEVPFRLLIGEEPEEPETEPETTNLVSAAYDTLPYRNARVYGEESVNEWAFAYPDHMKWESADELFLVIDSMEAYEALYPREPLYDAAFFEENVLLFVYCYCPDYVFAEELIDIAIIDGKFCPVLLLDLPDYVATAIGTSFVTAEVSRKDLTMPKGEVFLVIPSYREMAYYGYFRQLPLTPEERKVPVPFANAVLHRKDDAFGAWYSRYDRKHQLVVIDSYDAYMAQEPREAVYDAAFFEDHVLIFIFYHGMNYGESEYVRELTDLYALDGTLISTLTVEYTELMMEAMDITYVTAEVRREDLPETESGAVEVDWVLIKGQA